MTALGTSYATNETHVYHQSNCLPFDKRVCSGSSEGTDGNLSAVS